MEKNIPKPSSLFLKRYLIGQTQKERWVVVGKRQEYLLTDVSCNCRHFMVQALKSPEERCKHLEIRHQAKNEKNFDTFEITTETWRILRPYFFKQKN
ncbi:MAG: hypothetical protein ACXAC7_02375 [Candidatus Hodarchaeales archaeon]|jgi:predicted nucleic acid-binding Zn finger protein